MRFILASSKMDFRVRCKTLYSEKESLFAHRCHCFIIQQQQRASLQFLVIFLNRTKSDNEGSTAMKSIEEALHSVQTRQTPLPVSESCSHLGKNCKYKVCPQAITPAPCSTHKTQYRNLKHILEGIL